MSPDRRHELRCVFSDVSLALLAYTALVLLLSALSALPYYLGMTDLYFSDWYYYLSNSVVVYLSGFLAMGLLLRHLPAPKLVPQAPPTGREIFSGGMVALGVMYLASWFTQLLLMNTGAEDIVDSYMTDTPFVYVFLTTVIIAPICEEIIFRKLLQDRLLFLGDWTALLISSLFFGLFHGNLYQFFYAFAVGLVLGYIRIMTGRMGWNILLHMFINLFCGVLPTWVDTELTLSADVYDMIYSVMDLVIFASMVYAVVYLAKHKPWRNLYKGPTDLTAKEKRSACLTSIPFWACVAAHLAMSVWTVFGY